MALPALLLVLGFALTVQSVVAARAGCADAARAGARAAARGESDGIVVDTARRAEPRIADVRVERGAGVVRVIVLARPRTVVPRVPLPVVSAASVAADEGVP